MARLKQGFLGNASGKLGNVVFSKWKDLQTVRQYQPDVQDANSPEQQKQRSRMVALLQLLKPLNKNFIKFFNSPVSKGSTPWATAISDNMNAIAPDGCFIPENFSLGKPKYSPINISDVIYNPFIDLCTVRYKPTDLSGFNDPYPYIGTSVLGKYESGAVLHEFDTRHQLCYLPEGSFFCSFYDDSHEHVFENWWGHGWLWLMYYDTYNIESYFNPNNGLTEPANFQPVSIIEEFNTKIAENPVPADAIHWEYQQKDGKWFLVVSVDIKKTQIKKPADYNIRFWSLTLQDGKYSQSEATEWNLSNTTYKAELIDSIARKASVHLYSVHKKDGEQVGRFNRFYINKDVEGKEHPYFDQLFNSCYAHPVSFILPDNQCGFCGSFTELFSDFINLYEQGVIYNHEDPAPTEERLLRIGTAPNGLVKVFGYSRQEESAYYFADNTTAVMLPIPPDGYSFSEWSGADAGEIIAEKEGGYTLRMSKDCSVTAVFKHNK
ncbi:MAG: DUF6266 family protein [Bacteroidota bacterium]